MAAVLHVVLWTLFWLFAGVVALFALVLLLLCIPLGVRLTNHPGKLHVWARIGCIQIRLTPEKELSQAQKARKEAKKQRKAAKKAAKKERKRLKAERKAKASAKRSSPKKKPGKPFSPPGERDTFGIIRALLAALADYDCEYLKLVCIRHLDLTVTVGGGNPAETGKRYAKAAELFGAFYPIVMRKLNVRKHRVCICPDFVRNRTNALFDATVTVTPIRILIAALVFWRAFRRNQRIYCKPRQKTEQTTIRGGTRAHAVSK